MAPRWSDGELSRLYALWGEKPIEEIAELLNRTPGAVAERAYLLGLEHPDNRTLTLARAAEKTGYDKRSLLRAASYLGLELRRCVIVTPEKNLGRAPRSTDIRRGREYALDEDTLKRLTHWLALHPAGRRKGAAWTRNFGPDGPAPACRGCGRTGIRHAGKLLCYACYEKARERRQEARRKERPPVEHQQGKHERVCPECALIFRAEHPTAKYCSRTCRRKHNGEKVAA